VYDGVVVLHVVGCCCVLLLGVSWLSCDDSVCWAGVHDSVSVGWWWVLLSGLVWCFVGWLVG